MIGTLSNGEINGGEDDFAENHLYVPWVSAVEHIVTITNLRVSGADGPGRTRRRGGR